MIFPDGRMELISEKIFPSLPVREREKIRAGRILRTLDLAFVRVGAVICVDAMYPEIARCLALRGAELILNPASIPENRASLWRSLASVRAAENTVFWATVMLMESTYPDGRPVRGGSVAADPKGEIIADSGALEQAIRVKIDLSVLEGEREVALPERYLELKLELDLRDPAEMMLSLRPASSLSSASPHQPRTPSPLQPHHIRASRPSSRSLCTP